MLVGNGADGCAFHQDACAFKGIAFLVGDDAAHAEGLFGRGFSGGVLGIGEKGDLLSHHGILDSGAFQDGRHNLVYAVALHAHSHVHRSVNGAAVEGEFVVALGRYAAQDLLQAFPVCIHADGLGFRR